MATKELNDKQQQFLYYKDKDYTLYKGKMQDVLSTFEENSIDSIVCDPPYHLTSIQKRFGKENSAEAKYGEDGSFQRLSKGFMGQTWDGGDTAFQVDTWKHCFRVLKDGGYLLAFGGTRTFHRIACAIEDAGFEIRDTIMWLYGSGFPKSMNIGKGIEAKEKLGNAGTRNKRKIEQSCDSEEYSLKQTNNGAMGEIIETTRKEYIAGTELSKKWSSWGTCLKPAYEPIIVARKPFKGSLVDNVIKNGVGGINIDECRIPTSDDLGRINKTDNGMFGVGNNNNNKAQQCKEQGIEYGGRFPANVILTYDETDFDEVCGGMPYTQSGSKISYGSIRKKQPDNCYKLGFTQKEYNNGQIAPDNYGDEGNASRYFYCAKATTKDRDEGLEMFEIKTKVFNGKSDSSSEDMKDVEKRFTTKLKNIHPTVKPVDLMQYLVRLVSPKGSKVLDCFMGSGSTGKACMFENRERNANYHFIGIEMTDEYLPIAKSRIDYAKYKYQYDEIKEKEERKEKGIQNLFDILENED